RSETFWFGSDERSGARPAAGAIGRLLLLWGDAARRPEAPRWVASRDSPATRPLLAHSRLFQQARLTSAFGYKANIPHRPVGFMSSRPRLHRRIGRGETPVMERYGQFCPVAKAAEIFCVRWTPLIVRDLAFGASRVSELQRGVPLASPTLL